METEIYSLDQAREIVAEFYKRLPDAPPAEEKRTETPETDGPPLILRADFDRLSATERMTFIRAGGRVVDAMDKPGRAYKPGASKTITRAAFDNLTPREAMEFVKAGGRIID